MPSCLLKVQSISVEIYGRNPSAGILTVVERADNPADTRTFELPMSRRELQQLRDDISRELAKEPHPA